MSVPGENCDGVPGFFFKGVLVQIGIALSAREWETMAQRTKPRNPLFGGRWFEDEIIIVCLRWYFRYKLSYRDLVEMMAERGLLIAHTTILRWAVQYAETFRNAADFGTNSRWAGLGGATRPILRYAANGYISTGLLMVRGTRSSFC
jgi:hypothetical protein